MVRTSPRQQALNRIDDVIYNAMKHSIKLKLFGMENCHVRDFVFRAEHLKQQIKSKRYFQNRKKSRKRTKKFKLYLDANHDDALDDKEFRFHFRMDRTSFWHLVSLIQDKPQFQSREGRGRKKMPCAHYLLILLKYMGTNGNQASSTALSNFFGIGYGAVNTDRDAALQALLLIEKDLYFWPGPDERKAISSRIQEEHLFPNCVGLIDGTLLPLHEKPLIHGENYLSRKRFYAIVMLVICDDYGRILFYHVGWPGSVHDNRVWRNTDLCHRGEKYFSPKEYLLGDSAFTPGRNMVVPFKTAAGQFLSGNKGAFNTLLARPRVKSEHCIGILKGRLPFLKGIRIQFHNKKSYRRLIDCVRGAVILHNFLIPVEEKDEWYEAVDVDDLEAESQNASVEEPNFSRRNELMSYFSEVEGTNIY